MCVSHNQLRLNSDKHLMITCVPCFMLGIRFKTKWEGLKSALVCVCVCFRYYTFHIYVLSKNVYILLISKLISHNKHFFVPFNMSM